MAISVRSPERPRLKRAARREQLLTVAESIVANSGISALTMERLADEARISKPVVYSHFENRGQLLLALLQDYWSHLDEAVNRERSLAKSADDELPATVRAYFEAIEARGPVMRTVLSERSSEPVVEEARRHRELAVEKEWAGDFETSFGVDPATAAAAAAILRRALEGASGYWVASGADSSAVQDVFVTIVRASLPALAKTKRRRRRR